MSGFTVTKTKDGFCEVKTEISGSRINKHTRIMHQDDLQFLVDLTEDNGLFRRTLTKLLHFGSCTLFRFKQNSENRIYALKVMGSHIFQTVSTLEIPKSIIYVKSLETLVLDRIHISKEAIENLSCIQLKHFDLIRVSFLGGSSFTKLKNLFRKLNLQTLLIREIGCENEDFRNLVSEILNTCFSLTALNIDFFFRDQNNCISVSLKGLKKLKHLKRIEIENMTVKETHEIATLTQLNHIVFRNCGLKSEFLRYLKKLKKLEILKLSHNQIKTIPSEFGNWFPYLHTLVLTKNLLTSIPKSFENLSLSVLYLNANLLETLPDIFNGSLAIYLQKLYLESNSLYFIPPSLISLHNLGCYITLIDQFNSDSIFYDSKNTDIFRVLKTPKIPYVISLLKQDKYTPLYHENPSLAPFYSYITNVLSQNEIINSSVKRFESFWERKMKIKIKDSSFSLLL